LVRASASFDPGKIKITIKSHTPSSVSLLSVSDLTPTILPFLDAR